LYYKIAAPLANALYTSGDQAGAHKIIDDTRSLLQPTQNGPLDSDMATLERKISAPPPKKNSATTN